MLLSNCGEIHDFCLCTGTVNVVLIYTQHTSACCCVNARFSPMRQLLCSCLNGKIQIISEDSSSEISLLFQSPEISACCMHY